MAISAQGLTIHPSQGYGIDDFFAVQAQHLCDHGGGSHLDQNHVIQTDLVERVFQRDTTLNFVRLNHAGQHGLHAQGLLARSHGIARQPISSGQNAAQIVGRMTPFGSQPGVIEVQPANHRADIEGSLNRIQLELRAGHFRAIRYHSAGHHGAKQLGASGIFQRFQAAAQGVDQAVAGSFIGHGRLDFVVHHVVNDVNQNLVGGRTDVGDVCGHIVFLCFLSS